MPSTRLRKTRQFDKLRQHPMLPVSLPCQKEVQIVSEKTRQQVTISVDLKKYRIRIHRNTLSMLGTPKYVQLLVSPSAMMLAIQGTDKRTNFTHRVNLDALHPDNSYEIYSTLFVNKLCSLVSDLDTGCTYRLTGEIIAEENAAVFPLSSLQKVDSLEEQ